MEMKTVRFTEPSTLERVGKPALVYEQGRAYTLRADRAQRWIKRGRAVEVSAAESAQAEKAPEITVAEYDRVATDVAVGLYDLDYAVPQMATHYRLDEKAIRAELEPRIEKIKAATADNATKGASDGNAVGSAADVGGKDGGDTGVGGEHVAGRGRGGARGGRSGGGGQSHA